MALIEWVQKNPPKRVVGKEKPLGKGLGWESALNCQPGDVKQTKHFLDGNVAYCLRCT